MFIQKIVSAIGNKVEAGKIKKIKMEELAQDMADWLPPEGYGHFGKTGRRAVQIIAEREKEAAGIVKKNNESESKMLSGTFMDILS